MSVTDPVSISDYEFATQLRSRNLEFVAFARPRMFGWFVVLAMASVAAGTALGFAL